MTSTCRHIFMLAPKSFNTTALACKYLFFGR